MGPSFGFPWTWYILAAATSYESVRQVCKELMDVEVDGDRLWRYAKLEAPVGPPLDFATA
jgi:hypothetical protein